MAPGLEMVENTAAAVTTKDQVLHLENTNPLKKHRFSRTKNFTAADIISFATPQHNHDLLQASPYSDRAHLLDLNTLEKPLQLFAEALTGMRWITRDFATAPYDKAFNWDSIADIFSRSMRAEQPAGMLDSQHFYVIVFRSRVNKHADRQLLGELDKTAHLEAVEGGGLLKYWFGTPNEVGRNLATCKYQALTSIVASSNFKSQASGETVQMLVVAVQGLDTLRLCELPLACTMSGLSSA
jgi:hypothetical protein